MKKYDYRENFFTPEDKKVLINNIKVLKMKTEVERDLQWRCVKKMWKKEKDERNKS